MHFYQNTSVVEKSLDNKGGIITSKKLQPLTGQYYHNYFGTAGGQSAFDRQGQIPPYILRKVSEKAFLINICINHACRLSSPFTRPITEKTTKGFSISLKNKNTQITAEHKKRITELENFFINCGFDKDNERGTLLRFMKKGIRDLLTLDQITTEIQYRHNGIPFAFWTIDPATIYRHARTSEDDNIDFVQLVDCIPVAEYTNDQLIFDIMNPRSDIEHSLYGYSYVEQAIELITGMINSFTYNQGNFINDNLPRGAVLINGDPDQPTVDIISDYIVNMMSDPSQKWRIPVFPSGSENGSIQWVSFQKGNRDMEFTEWTNRLWTSVTALFGTDLEELGIRVNTGTSVIPENPEARIKASKSRVLDDILRFFQDHFQHILDLIDDRYCFEFVGAEQNDLKLQNECRTNKLSTCYTVNEVRKEEGLEPLEDKWANIPLNPQLIILRGQMAGEQQAQQGSGLEDDDDPNDTDAPQEDEYHSKYEDIDIDVNKEDVEKSLYNEFDHPRAENGRFASKGNKIKSLISQFKDFKPIKINADDFYDETPKQHIRNVLKYCLKNLRGEYTNEYTNESIEVVKRTFEHILHHGAKKEAHIDSVLVIPEIVKKMLFVGSEPNQDLKVNPDIEKYNYYISCISVKGKEYIVKSVIGISKGNTKYYDHTVISQSKSEFVETLSEISESRESTNPLSQQDKRLFNILQAESLRKSLNYQLTKSINKSTITKLDYFKKKVIDILVSQENENIEKAVKANIGEVRTRKDGFKYKKVNNGEWKRIYESETRGARHSIAAIKRKIDNAKDEEELMHIIMTNKQRFVDSMGFMLPIVKELNDYIDQKQATKAKPVVKENLTTEKEKKKVLTDEQKENLSTINNILTKNIAPMPKKIDFTKENFNKLFKDGINSPIEHIKIGENQFEKMKAKNREGLLAIMADVMKNPALIIKTTTGEKIYAKKYDGLKQDKNVVSVIIDKDNLHINISTHIERNNQLAKKTDSILYERTESIVHGEPPPEVRNFKDSTVPQSDEKSSLDDIKTKYQSSKSVSGDEDEIILPDGSTVSGTWKIVEATAPSASHDEKTFQKTNGFPTNTDGSTINDRDYEHDTQAQEMVHKIASDYDGRALSLDNPVVVTQDGVVISGNNRTMSSKIAARKGTDSKYIETLAKRCKKFGFSEDDLKGFKNPRIVFETQQNNYSTKEFAKYNQSDKKTISPIEQAVKISKTIDFNTVENIAESISQYETLGDMYQDKDVCSDIFNSLKESSIVSEFDLPQYINNGIPTVAGKDFLETVLIGSVINENNLRSLNQDGCKNIRAKLVRAILPLTKNKGLKNGYSVNKELNEAIEIYAEIANDKNIKNVKEYAQQGNFFKEPNALALAFAEKLEGTQKEFAQLMNDMNGSLREAADGQFDMFFGGIESRENILSRFLEIKKSLRQLKKNLNKSRNAKVKIAKHSNKIVIEV